MCSKQLRIFKDKTDQVTKGDTFFTYANWKSNAGYKVLAFYFCKFNKYSFK